MPPQINTSIVAVSVQLQLTVQMHDTEINAICKANSIFYHHSKLSKDIFSDERIIAAALLERQRFSRCAKHYVGSFTNCCVLQSYNPFT